MKTIYKALIAFIAISLMVSAVVADEDGGKKVRTNENINSNIGDDGINFNPFDTGLPAEMRTLEPADEAPEGYIPSINPHNIPIYNIPSYIPVQIPYMNGQC